MASVGFITRSLNTCIGFILATILANLLWLSIPAYAVSAAPAASHVSNEVVRLLEIQCYGHNYDAEPMPNRLSRLEVLLFGSAHAQNTEADRIKALSGFVLYNPSAPKMQGPVKPQAGESEYPTIEAMETQVFGKTFEKEPVESRLVRLEQRVFGQPQPGALADRTDRLEGRLNPYGKTIAQQQTQQADNAYAASNPAEDAQVANALTPLEQRYFNRAFPQDPLDLRLTRLENIVFNEPAPDLSPSDRLYRLNGVLNAQQAARAEDNGYIPVPQQQGGYTTYPNSTAYQNTTPYTVNLPSQQYHRRSNNSALFMNTLQMMLMIMSFL